MRTTIKIREGDTTDTGEEIGFFGSVVVEMPNQQQRSELVRKFGGRKRPGPEETIDPTEKLDQDLKIYDEMIELAVGRIHACNLKYIDREEEEVTCTDAKELVVYREGLSTLLYVSEMIIGGIVLGKKKKHKSSEA